VFERETNRRVGSTKKEKNKTLKERGRAVTSPPLETAAPLRLELLSVSHDTSTGLHRSTASKAARTAMHRLLHAR
jgi:hypothetical protein